MRPQKSIAKNISVYVNAGASGFFMAAKLMKMGVLENKSLAIVTYLRMKRQIQKNQNMMKQFIISVIFFAGFMSAVTASGKVVSQDRNVSDFQAIQIKSSVDVEFTQGDDFKVVVYAEQDIIEEIITEVNKGTLVVNYKSSSKIGWFSSTEDAYVEVTAPELSKVHITGSGDFEGENTINSESFMLRINGSGDFESALDVRNMEVHINGSGDAEFSGVNETLDISINGSGDVECNNVNLALLKVNIYGSGDVQCIGSAENISLKQGGSGDFYGKDCIADNVKANKSGSGDATVTAKKAISVNSNGSGDTVCYGNPDKVNQKINGSGDLHLR